MIKDINFELNYSLVLPAEHVTVYSPPTSISIAGEIIPLSIVPGCVHFTSEQVGIGPERELSDLQVRMVFPAVISYP